MTRQQILDQIYAILVELRLRHPHGLHAVGSANAFEFYTRHGVDPQIAERLGITHQWFEEEGGGVQNPMDIIEGIDTQLLPDGSLTEPADYTLPFVLPGQQDPATGLWSHPDKWFTAANHNDKRFGIHGDASQMERPGLPCFEDWRNADELEHWTASGLIVLDAWDARENRPVRPGEYPWLIGDSN